IAEVLRRLRDEFGLTVIITEQNANFAMTLAERLYVLEAGRVQAEGSVTELRDDPRLIEAYFGR
ncbi:MAG: ABC transporter ATP-binding protein, partial [Paracoccaceae bacterium]